MEPQSSSRLTSWKLSSASAATSPSFIREGSSLRDRSKNCAPVSKRKRHQRATDKNPRERNLPSKKFSCASSAGRAAPTRNSHGWDEFTTPCPRPTLRHRQPALAHVRQRPAQQARQAGAVLAHHGHARLLRRRFRRIRCSRRLFLLVHFAE